MKNECKYYILMLLLIFLAFAIMCERLLDLKNTIIENQQETIIELTSNKLSDNDARLLKEANMQYNEKYNVFGGK